MTTIHDAADRPTVAYDTIRASVEGSQTSVTPIFHVEVALTADGSAYVGQVDGHPFRLMLAMKDTARRERIKALRRAAAWQAIIDAGMTTGDQS